VTWCCKCCQREIIFNTKKTFEDLLTLNETICGVWLPAPPQPWESSFIDLVLLNGKTYSLHSFFHTYFAWQPIRYCELKSWDSKDTGFNFHRIIMTLDMLLITSLLYPWNGNGTLWELIKDIVILNDCYKAAFSYTLRDYFGIPLMFYIW